MAIMSGQTAVAAAGTPVRLAPNGNTCNGPITVKALPSNTGNMFVGNVNDGLPANNGFMLAKGEAIVINFVNDIGDIWVDCSVAGEKVCWIMGIWKL